MLGARGENEVTSRQLQMAVSVRPGRRLWRRFEEAGRRVCSNFWTSGPTETPRIPLGRISMDSSTTTPDNCQWALRAQATSFLMVSADDTRRGARPRTSEAPRPAIYSWVKSGITARTGRRAVSFRPPRVGPCQRRRVANPDGNTRSCPSGSRKSYAWRPMTPT